MCACNGAGDDSSLPKEQMGQLRQVLISSFFRQVKEVCYWIIGGMYSSMRVKVPNYITNLPTVSV